MNERQKANEIIVSVERDGVFERSEGKEFFQITKFGDTQYTVKILDSDTTQDNHKLYTHDREGLEEFLTALLGNPVSILHRL